MTAWRQEAAQQRAHRAILEKYARRLKYSTQAAVLRTWAAVTSIEAEMHATASECHARLLSRRLAHALGFWRSQAMYKRETKRLLKACPELICFLVSLSFLRHQHTVNALSIGLPAWACKNQHARLYRGQHSFRCCPGGSVKDA